MSTSTPHDPKLARSLILDELFDLSLYQALRNQAWPDTRQVLDELIQVEKQHLAFWQKFFDTRLDTLDFPRRIKLRFIILVCRIVGAPAIHLVLEAIEVYGVRKYLSLWKHYRDGPFGQAIKGILEDEFKHEDVLVTQLTARKINPERIRNIFFIMFSFFHFLLRTESHVRSCRHGDGSSYRRG